MNIEPVDIDIIRTQIGREPQGIVRIAARAANGCPQVLQMQSIVDNKPFPTLYWLSGKAISKAIGSIETSGWVKDIELKLQQDEVLREAYYLNQRQYVAKREEQMTERDKALIAERGMTQVFAGYGIGGIAQWDKVRCLHMQYAHHLADGNVIGELLDQEFELYKILQQVDVT